MTAGDDGDHAARDAPGRERNNDSEASAGRDSIDGTSTEHADGDDTSTGRDARATGEHVDSDCETGDTTPSTKRESIERDPTTTEVLTRASAGRWGSALVAALLVSLLALVLGEASLFVLAVVAFGFVLVSQRRGHDTVSLSLERTLEETRPTPGRSVEITLSVTNESDRVLPDVRVVDEPPDSVRLAGSPAFATSLRPGETTAHTYTVTPPRGTFTFGSPTVRYRNLVATTVTTLECASTGDSSFTCETLLDSVPLLDRTIQFVGRTPTDDGGSGVEFYATREYRRGDPINRIDWHRLARTGELATVEFREERAVTLVFVIDDRPAVQRTPPGGGPNSLDLTLYAASRGVVASLEDGNRTGLLTLAGAARLEPGVGSDVAHQISQVLDDSAGTTSEWGRRLVTDGGLAGLEIEALLPRRAQVVFCTPLADDTAVELVETLRTRGRGVTVVSPDLGTGPVAPTQSVGVRLCRLERRNRLDTVRATGATVVDWDLSESLATPLARALSPSSRGGRWT